ncbi:MAG: MBL fold metallo-hydrolase [Oscillospiraceae bacterium]|jgi:beta-lactamase superfamily II metal-dependent hydrolase|nr:MBL fold metallo-hydrolase [Oscillospiraceae bacterium]
MTKHPPARSRLRRWLLWCCLPLLAVGGCAAPDAEGATLTALKVGKADALILKAGAHTVLIDAGEDEDSAEILSFLKKQGVEALDALVVTHFDKDHVGGADGILRGIAVSAVYDAAYESDSTEYRAYEAALAETGVPRTRVGDQTALTFGALTLTLIPSPVVTDQDNDRSLSLSVTDGRHSFLLPGDAEEALIDALLGAGLAAHDILKLPHHGRWKENLPALLDAVQPRAVFITDSQKNPAEASTLALLAERGIRTHCTKDGDIAVRSGASGLTVTQ